MDFGGEEEIKISFPTQNVSIVPERLSPKFEEKIGPEIWKAKTQTIVEEWVKEVPFTNEEALPVPDPNMVWAMIDDDLNYFMCELVSEVEIPSFLDNLVESPKITSNRKSHFESLFSMEEIEKEKVTPTSFLTMISPQAIFL